MTTLQFLHWLSQQDAPTRSFFSFIHTLAANTNHQQAQAVTESTHSVPGDQFPVVYAGSPLQAFLVALYNTVVEHIATAFVWVDQAG